MMTGDKSRQIGLLRVSLCLVVTVTLCSCQAATQQTLSWRTGKSREAYQAADPTASASAGGPMEANPSSPPATSMAGSAAAMDTARNTRGQSERQSSASASPMTLAADIVADLGMSSGVSAPIARAEATATDGGEVRQTSYVMGAAAGDPAPLATPQGAVMMPPSTYAAAPGCASCANSCATGCSPSYETFCGPPYAPQPAWRGPGRWPHSEYVCDGGDRDASVDVMPDWTVRGLDQEDTVVHFDTTDGQTQVEPANRVCLYAPRFAAVRQVSGLLTHKTRDRVAGVEIPVGAILQEETTLVTTVNQPLQAGRYLGTDGPQLFQEDVRGAAVVADEGLVGLANRLRPYEDLQLIRDGVFDNTQKARLSVSMDAALAWTENQAVQVAIDNITTVVANNDVSLQSVYRYDLPPGKPRVRIVKLASTKHAQPGDLVEFTIRFDNIGDQAVGNVTIVDNLATRLEYVPDTQECSLEADFLTQDNTGESLVLRWEIREPMAVGEGGLIRFTCRVR